MKKLISIALLSASFSTFADTQCALTSNVPGKRGPANPVVISDAGFFSYQKKVFIGYKLRGLAVTKSDDTISLEVQNTRICLSDAPCPPSDAIAKTQVQAKNLSGLTLQLVVDDSTFTLSCE